MQKIFLKAAKKRGITGETIIQLLERRLDNSVFRLGLAPSRSVARQLVSHGHIVVNSRKVTIPSFSVVVGNVIGIRPASKDHPIFKEMAEAVKKYEPPVWLNLNKETLEGKVVGLPKDLETSFDVNVVVDYYSK